MGDPHDLTRRVDRAALERVLARAAELQTGSGEGSDPGDALTESQVVDLAKEVGLSPIHVRQALAEERTRVAVVPDDTGIAASVLGVGRVRASRVVPGTPREAHSCPLAPLT